MPVYGLCLRVTHTGKARASLPLNDINDGIGKDTGDDRFRRFGPGYVPVDGSIDLVYAGDVAKSFENGTIRGYIDSGHVTANFVVGLTYAAIFPDIEDEGVLLTSTPSALNFVGAGVMATAVGGRVTITIPGGGAATDHSTLSNLNWLVAGHTGNPDTLAGFDGAGDAVFVSRAVTGDVTGTFPGPLQVTGLTFVGQAEGALLYFDGSDWVVLPPGAAGQVLQTGGPGDPPSWVAPSGGVTDHAALTNLLWTSSGHTGLAERVAYFDGAGEASYLALGVDIQAWAEDLDALAALSTTGILSRTAAGTYATRTITGSPDRIVVTNGDGVAGNPVLDLGGDVLLVTTPLGGDLSGTLPNPQVVGFTIPGAVQGSVLYFDGADWVHLPPGVVGQVLQTGGVGADPSWEDPPGNPDLPLREITALKLLWKTAVSNQYTEYTYNQRKDLVQVDVWEDDTKAVKLFTRTLTYNAQGDLIQVVTTDETSGSVLTTDLTYTGRDLVTKTETLT